MAVDRRIRKTRTALKDAVLALASQRDLDAISVQDIVDQADVSRATFYVHYKSKEDLVTEALDSLFETFGTEAAEFRKESVELRPGIAPSSLVHVLRRMSEDPDLYVRLFGDGGASAWIVRLRTLWEEQFLLIWRVAGRRPCDGSTPIHLRASLGASILVRMVSWWLDGHREVPPESIADWCWDLSAHLWFDHTMTGTGEEQQAEPTVTVESFHARSSLHPANATAPDPSNDDPGRAGDAHGAHQARRQWM